MNHNSIQFNISNIYDWSVKGWHFLDLIDSTATYQYHYLCSCATHSLARSMRMFLQFLVWRWTSSSRWRSHLTVILINKTNNQGEIQLSFFCFKSTARSRYLRSIRGYSFYFKLSHFVASPLTFSSTTGQKNWDAWA